MHGMRLRTLGLATGLVFAASSAYAQAIIFNGNGAPQPGGTASLALGINAEGHLNLDTGNVALNSSRTGLAIYSATGRTVASDSFGVDPTPGYYDSTSPGCFCEGWGVSFNGTTSGYANVSSDGGAVNLTAGAMTGVTSTTATSNVTVSGTGLSVSQAYSVSDKTNNLFKDVVTITNNTGAAITDLKYVRVMDWDIPFDEFNELVTIKGTATTAALEYSSNQGFASANPLAGDPGGIGGGTVDVDFEDVGPADHGAYFRFNFGGLADGESKTFSIFYGGAYSEADALAAIGAEAIELYSLGQTGAPNGDGDLGTPFTFIFGFKGVGGVAQEPDPTGVPEPATLVLFATGLAGVAWARRRKALAA